MLLVKPRPRKTPWALIGTGIAAAGAVISCGWWLWPRGGIANAQVPAATLASDESCAPPIIFAEPETQLESPKPADATAAAPPVEDEPLSPRDGAGQALVSLAADPAPAPVLETPANPEPKPQPEPEPTTPVQPASAASGRNPKIDAILERKKNGDVIEARHELNAMLAATRDPAEQAELRRQLADIADETIFSARRATNDPLIEQYTIKPGDRLTQIAPRYDVPYDILLAINHIPDASKIRAGQQIVIPRGPFHARIYKSAFRMDIYLQDLYVKSLPVGLGADPGTPTGVWKVENRLPNPTYHPPASARDKRIIHANDPSNPLGEHWIGLKGIEGEAVGRDGYGIHGTIEPGSIGKAVSMGCVRMLNEDVAFVYRLLQPGSSSVTILP